MTVVSPKTLKRTYYPCKTFDDDLDAFAQLATTEKWSFSGVDIATIVGDAVDQRAERAQHDAAEGQFYKLHETFGLAQQTRYQRFAAALNAARGAFRNDKAVVAQLDRFRRSVRLRKCAQPSSKAA
jgi:hypothetical protein